MNNRQGIYAIVDKVAKDILGGLHLHRHPTTAIRFFSDIARQPNTIIASHPEDFALVLVGWLDVDGEGDLSVVEDVQVVLEGASWAAAQNDNPSKEA